MKKNVRTSFKSTRTADKIYKNFVNGNMHTRINTVGILVKNDCLIKVKIKKFRLMMIIR